MTETPNECSWKNKLLILCVLAIQTTLHTLTVRYTRVRVGQPYLSSTVVTLCEIGKLIASFHVVLFSCNFDFCGCLAQVKKECFSSWVDFGKMLVPAILFTAQNNLLYLSLSNLPVAVHQVLNQMKILTTAFFSVLVLSKKITLVQWLAIAVLFLGIAEVELSGAKEDYSPAEREQSTFRGVVAVLTSSFSSGFACVWFEKILKTKGQPKGIWFANIQLALLCTVLGLGLIFCKDRDSIAIGGFFQGYTLCVWVLIFLQAAGGILVSLVMKYADNILKSFACSAAIVLSSIGSFFLFDFQFNPLFVSGTALVISAIFLYNRKPFSIKAEAKRKRVQVNEHVVSDFTLPEVSEERLSIDEAVEKNAEQIEPYQELSDLNIMTL